MDFNSVFHIHNAPCCHGVSGKLSFAGSSSTSSSAGTWEQTLLLAETQLPLCHGTIQVNLECQFRIPLVAPPQQHPELVRQGCSVSRRRFSFEDLQICDTPSSAFHPSLSLSWSLGFKRGWFVLFLNEPLLL